MAGKIKIHYYSISSNIPGLDLDGCLSNLAPMSIGQRTKKVGHGDVNLEGLEKDKHTGVWFMHFTALRETNWPGAAQKGQASGDLQLPLNVELTENTFAAFDPARGQMALQYTRSAVQASRLFGFIDAHTGHPNTFLYSPVLNRDAMTRYQQTQVFTAVDVVVEDIAPADVAYFQGSTIATTVGQSVAAGVTRLAISFSVDARVTKNKIGGNFVSNMVSSLLGRQSDKDKVVVRGRNNVASRVEKIDLLADVKIAEYDERRVTLTPGRRYLPSDMKTILLEALGY